MCGIAGVVSIGDESQRASIQAMIDVQRHRGPDDSGVWSDELCTLGHRRLSVIDLSDAGRQPLSNEDGTIWTTFNGEIYNFQTLRDELEALGHRFYTRTDTEVIVHAYEQWGTDCLKRFRGMFAFAIWDRRSRRLLLGRDRVGKKPLYYTLQKDRLLFASELQGLLANVDVPRDVDPISLDAYLSLGFIPAPRTAFQGVYKLPPAHWLTLDLARGEPVLHLERYWVLNYEPKLLLSEGEAGEALRHRLTEAVRLRLISDVPLGAFLSGGIDSSVVVGLMASLACGRVRTFAIGFEEAGFSELQHARRVAERWGTEHQECVLRPDALSILPKLVQYYGEPHADSSAIPTFYVSQISRRGVTVALSGDGGDETFAGYQRYGAHQIAERIGHLPGSGRAASFLMRALPRSLSITSRLGRARRFLEAAHHPAAERYCRWVGASTGSFSEEAKRQLYTEELREHVSMLPRSGLWEGLFDEAQDLHPLDAAMSVDVQSYLPYDLLVKLDVTSMANSLEVRSPFLDHEVMEFGARLPVHLKRRRGETKYLLKRSFRDLLPTENLLRSKMGFAMPLGVWFRGPVRELLCDSLLSGRLLARGYFRPEAVEGLVTEHLDGRAEHSFKLWNLLMLELWHQEVVDKAAEPIRPVPGTRQISLPPGRWARSI